MTAPQVILAAILLGSAAVRLPGIGYGLPLDLVPDEASLIIAALVMISKKTLIPALQPDAFRMLYYPPLIPWLYVALFVPVLGVQFLAGGFRSLEEFQLYLGRDQHVVWVTARLAQVCVGTLTVWLVYRIGTRLAGIGTGLSAALVLALSFNHVLMSHFSKHWIIATFFVTLVLYLSLVWPLTTPRCLALGVLCGLAFGASIIAKFAWLPYLGLYVYRERSAGVRVLLRGRLWASLAVGGLLTAVFVALHRQYFQSIFTSGIELGHLSVREPKSAAGFVAMLRDVMDVLVGQEPVFLALAAVGALLLWMRGHRAAVAGATGFIGVYLTYLYVLVEFESRYIVLCLPILALLGGYGFHAILERLARHGRWAPAAAAVAVVLAMLAPVAQLDRLLMRPDTRLLGKEWVEQRSRGALFIMDMGTQGVHVERSRLGAVEQRRYAGEASRDRAALTRDGGGGVFAVNIAAWHPQHRTIDEVNAFIERHRRGVERVYYVTTYWTPGTSSPVGRALMAKGRLVEVIDNGVGPVRVDHDFLDPVTVLFGMRRLGSRVEIYDLTKGPA